MKSEDEGRKVVMGKKEMMALKEADGIITLWKNKDIAEQPISLPEGGFGKKYAVLMDLVKYKNGFVSGQEMWLYGHYFRFDEASAGWMDRDQDGEA